MPSLPNGREGRSLVDHPRIVLARCPRAVLRRSRRPGAAAREARPEAVKGRQIMVGGVSPPTLPFGDTRDAGGTR